MAKDNRNSKLALVNSFLKFLTEEVNNLGEEQRDTIDVAIQCLETAFNIPERRDNLPAVDLLELIANRENEALDPAVAEQHKLTGNNAMQRGDYESALSEYTLAIQNNPNNAVYYCNRAAAYTRLDRNDDAIRDCKNAIRLDPQYGKAYGRLGIAYSNMGMYAEACDAYQSAIQTEPNNQVYHQNLMIAQQQLGQQQQQQQQQQPQQQQQQQQQPAGAAGPAGGDPNRMFEFLNNETLLHLASQMMSTPEFGHMMAGLVNEPGAPNLDILLQLGSVLANQLQQSNPGLANHLRTRFTVTNPNPTHDAEPIPVGEGNPEEEDNGEDDDEEDDDGDHQN